MKEGRLKVVYISSWYPNRVRPLLGIFIKRHAQAIAKTCDVSALYVCSDDEEGTEVTTEDDIFTIRVYYKKVRSSIPLYSSVLKLTRYITAWKKAVKIYTDKKELPDIINSNIVFPVSVVAMYLKRKWKVPYVITEHWTGYFPEDGRYKGTIMKFITKTAVKLAANVITDSNRLKKQMLDLGLRNTYYSIPNVVNGNLFSISGKKDLRKDFKFIHVSALDEEQKNVSGIINAFSLLAKRLNNISLTIVGGGDTLEDLKRLSNSLKLENSVTFTGTKTGDELVKLLNESNAFILFSNYENLPCVMLEAMCCGLPVIGTRVGDVPEYINETNGILIDARNETQLVAAMEQVIKNYNRYNPTEIRNAILYKVSPDAVAKEFKEVYENVLSNR